MLRFFSSLRRIEVIKTEILNKTKTEAARATKREAKSASNAAAAMNEKLRVEANQSGMRLDRFLR
jgi:hypothetical protein